MLAKLLSLLIHAKAGAITGVFLLGATGALVSVSTQNGVTTITLTDPSPSPSASAIARPSASTDPAASASPTLSSALNLLSSPKLADACSDETKAITLQVQRVDGAFKTFHTDLMTLRGQRDRATIETADEMLKLVRRSAVTAIHATATCKKPDEDETGERDVTTGATSLNADREKDEDNDKDHGKKTLITFTGDATAIADQAIELMRTAFNTAKDAPVATPKPTHSPEQKKTDNNNKKHDSKGSEHHD